MIDFALQGSLYAAHGLPSFAPRSSAVIAPNPTIPICMSNNHKTFRSIDELISRSPNIVRPAITDRISQSLASAAESAYTNDHAVPSPL